MGIGLIVLSAALQRLAGHLFGVRAPALRRPAEGLLIRAFTLITFPLVVLIWLAAAIWLLPYLLVSKPYRLHLRETRQSRQAKQSPWPSSDPFSGQLGSLDVLDFLRLPYAPVFAFLDWLDRGPGRWGAPRRAQTFQLPLQESSSEASRPDAIRPR